MWTERERVLVDIDEILQYLDSIGAFHDYRLGNVAWDGRTFGLTIEEDAHSAPNAGAHVWDFTFNSVSHLKIDMDCGLPSYFVEIEIDDHSVVVGLTNGSISFHAGEMKLGIPKL